MDLWIIISFGLLVSSVILYLFIRKSNDIKMPVNLQNLGMFLLPAIFIGFYNLFSGKSFYITPTNLLIIILSAIFFSWLGNILSLIALQKSPNPGYSLIISKSYVIMTTVFSVWIFGSPISFKSISAIILIIIFSGIIVINKKEVHNLNKKNKSWVLYTVGAFFSWGFLALVLKYLTQIGLNPTIVLFYLMLFVSVLIIFQIIFFNKNQKLTLNRNNLLIFMLIGIFSAIFNLFNIFGYYYSPNPGYINAINAGSIGLVTLFSSFIFKDELSFRKIVGVFGIILSIILLLF